ncbi:MAG: hypothetical protein U0441_14975 [Polyangiaceae bacterium]
MRCTSFTRVSFVASLAFVLVPLLQGCAPHVPPREVRLADIGKGGPLLPGQALIVEVQEGDTIPLSFSLRGPFMATPEDAPPIPLRAKRHFFLRIDKDGLRASADGKHFDERPVKPGSFQIGLGATKEGVRATIAIETPVPVDAGH